MNILAQIAAYKQKEVNAAKEVFPQKLLEQLPAIGRRKNGLKDKLLAKPGIIAEFKRQSPSKKLIAQMADPTEIVKQYYKAGAAACSILTDTRFFGGSSNDLFLARQATALPLLRKDFMVDTYQFVEAKAWGADIVLLIAAILTPAQVKYFTALAHDLEMEVLLELHEEQELGHICEGIDMVGINNRDLKTFGVSLEKSAELVRRLPRDIPAIAESGIQAVEDMLKLRKAGFGGFLVGEKFMSNDSPGNICKEFVDQL